MNTLSEQIPQTLGDEHRAELQRYIDSDPRDRLFPEGPKPSNNHLWLDGKDSLPLPAQGSRPGLEDTYPRNFESVAEVIPASTTETMISDRDRAHDRASKIKRRVGALLLATVIAMPASVQVRDVYDRVTGRTNATKMTMDILGSPTQEAIQMSQTMQDLETGNKAAILERAEIYREANIDQLPSDELIKTTKDDIAKAQTNDKVAEALGNFMSFYGKEVDFLSKKEADSLSQPYEKVDSFSKDTPVADTKRVAYGTVNAIDYLPKKLLEIANFKKYMINNSSIVGGVESFGEVIIGTNSNLYNTTLGTIEQKFTGSGSTEWVALHEIAHSLQSSESLTDDKQPSPLARIPKEVSNAVKTAFTGSPDNPTDYATVNRAERDAEIFAGAFTPNKGDYHGLADPRDGTNFRSKANSDMLKKIVDLQLNLGDSGNNFSDWVVTHNARLMSR